MTGSSCPTCLDHSIFGKPQCPNCNKCRKCQDYGPECNICYLCSSCCKLCSVCSFICMTCDKDYGLKKHACKGSTSINLLEKIVPKEICMEIGRFFDISKNKLG